MLPGLETLIFIVVHCSACWWWWKVEMVLKAATGVVALTRVRTMGLALQEAIILPLGWHIIRTGPVCYSSTCSHAVLLGLLRLLALRFLLFLFLFF